VTDLPSWAEPGSKLDAKWWPADLRWFARARCFIGAHWVAQRVLFDGKGGVTGEKWCLHEWCGFRRPFRRYELLWAAVRSRIFPL
jgi:hypothetical protein